LYFERKTGLHGGTIEVAPLGSITEEQFDKTFGINVKGLLFTVQKALPLFQDGGSIILTFSEEVLIIDHNFSEEVFETSILRTLDLLRN
jgi:hypothetical protein